MKNTIKELVSSKKALIYVTTVGTIAAIIFGGIDPEHASDFIDKLTALAMAYLGGQGLADLGKYAGEAYASGKTAVESRGEGGSVSEALAVATEAAESVDRVAEESKE